MHPIVFLSLVILVFVGLPMSIVFVTARLTEADLKREVVRASQPSIRVPLKRRMAKAAIIATTWLVVCPYFGYVLGTLAAFGDPGSNGYIFFFPSLVIGSAGALVHGASILRRESVPIQEP